MTDSLDWLTSEEKQWIQNQQCDIARNREEDVQVERNFKRVKYTNHRIGEMIIICNSLMKLKQLKSRKIALEITDRVRVRTRDSALPLGNVIEPNLIIELSKMGILMESCLIYIPEPLKVGDSFHISVSVKLPISIFSDSEASANRKRWLTRMFEKTGLIYAHELKRLELLDEMQDGFDITQDQLQTIYKNANLLGKNIDLVTIPPGFDITLRPYQHAGVSFMIGKEMGGIESEELSPMWREFESKDGIFYYCPYSGELSLDKPKSAYCYGGILADEMGLGKTIEILALIHTHKSTKPKKRTTLIVCPLNLISQWKEEFERTLPDHEILEYYGKDRSLTNLTSPLVLLTTYATLASDFKSGSGIFEIEWFRVVLDEAHYIRERSTQMAKTCFALKAKHKWAVTGTPIVNKLDDFYSLLHFLNVDPWQQHTFWKDFVALPFSKRDPTALLCVQSIMEPLILRRTKDMLDENGKRIVDLPPKEVLIEYLEFNSEERQLYDSINTFSKNEISIKSKIEYMHVFQLLTRLRQACDHPMLLKPLDERKILSLQDLIKQFSKESDPYAEQLKENVKQECPVCFEACDTILPCLHCICRPCLTSMVNRLGSSSDLVNCPLCRKEFHPMDTQRISNQQVNSTLSSTKIEALISQLKTYKHEPTKTVIFSQWSSMLDLIEQALELNGFSYTRMDGSKTKKSRDSSLTSFKNPKGPKILIATLRSTGVGLNLTIASKVFLMDPWWNSAVENQAWTNETSPSNKVHYEKHSGRKDVGNPGTKSKVGGSIDR